MINEQIQTKLQEVINNLTAKINDLSPVLELISAVISNAIDDNFNAQGRWDGNVSNINLFSGGTNRWSPLAESTKRQYKRKGYTLEPTLYRTKSLMSTIEVRPQGNKSIVIGANSPYAAIHQFGGTVRPVIPITKKVRKFFWASYYETGNEKFKYLALTKKAELKPVVKIPARPYLTLTSEDVQEIVGIFKTYLGG